MFEQQHILNKIEEWAERLPYKTLKIEIQLPDQTLTLEKEKTRSIGFSVPPRIWEPLNRKGGAAVEIA